MADKQSPSRAGPASRAALRRALLTALGRGRPAALFGGRLSGRSTLVADLVAADRAARRAGRGAGTLPLTVDLAKLAPAALPRSIWLAFEAALRDPYVAAGAPPPRLVTPPPALGTAAGWEVLAKLVADTMAPLRHTAAWLAIALVLEGADRLVQPEWASARAGLWPFAPAGAPRWTPLLVGGPALYLHVEASGPPSGWPRLAPFLLGPLLPTESAACAREAGLGAAAAAPWLAAAGDHPALVAALLAAAAAGAPDPDAGRADPGVAAVLAALAAALQAPELSQAAALLTLLAAAPGRSLPVAALAPALGVPTAHAAIDLLVISALARRTLGGPAPAVVAPSPLVAEVLGQAEDADAWPNGAGYVGG